MTWVTHLKKDILASIVVFLVAIPLCLGISLASGAPLHAAIISGIIGGIIVGLLSESQVSVSGPAAGMITVVIAAISQLGAFDVFLLALFFAGNIQILFGLSRVGFIANFVPSTVIKGLLAAIGILIIIKQLPLAIGYFSETGGLAAALESTQQDVTTATFQHILDHVSMGASIIAGISLVILCSWQKVPFTFLRIIPASFVVVLVGIAINFIYGKYFPAYALETFHLVNIPIMSGLSDLWSQIQHPNFAQIYNPNVYLHAAMLAIVASLETLLNIEAVEKIDKRHRYCSRDRELLAQGMGNALAGLVGGLPITSVIVRSSVNMHAGSVSKLSTVLHGVFLFLSLTLLATWLNYIPIAALAAILIYTGYKLARIALFVEVYREGIRYFIPFIVTIFAIVFTNLLVGILIGLAVSVFFILRHNSKNGFSVVTEKHTCGDVMRLMLPQQVTFLNRAAIICKLNGIPRNSKVIIDATFADYIDPDILEVILNARDTSMLEKNILCNLEGFQKNYDIQQSSHFLNVTTYDVQSSLSPDMILTLLKEGNNRFINNMPLHKNYKQQVAATHNSQHPMAVVLSCIDSRVPVELIFDLNLGDVFVVRVAGNILNADVLASIEYSCCVMGAKLIVVLGHKGCGAVRAACDDFKMGHITQLVEKIKPAVEMESHQPAAELHSPEFSDLVAGRNVQLVQAALSQQSPLIQELINKNKVGIVGGFYNIQTGEVQWMETEENQS